MVRLAMPRSDLSLHHHKGEFMKAIIGIRRVALPALALGLVWMCLPCMPCVAQTTYQPTYPEITRELTRDMEPKVVPGQEFPVPFKPPPRTITPCRACHGPEKDFPVNFKRKEALLVHTNLQLNHGGVRVWCLDCHHPDIRDYLLPLSDGKPIPFSESYRLCGKCHGTKFRDWRNGIHGKRVGSWDGEKRYYLCVHCHSPHNPKFKPIEPMPPPDKPRTPKEKQANH